MNEMVLCLATLMANFIMLTSPLSLKGADVPTNVDKNFRQKRKERTSTDELHTGSKKEIQDASRKALIFLCKSSCPDGEIAFSSKRNSSHCQILLAKLSGNDKVLKEVFKHCSSCSCNPKPKELHRKESKVQKNSHTDLHVADSVKSVTLTSKRQNSNSPSTNNDFILSTDYSQPLRYSQKYNPRNKISESGFVPVPGPYGFKSSTTKYPRLGQYRSDSYEDISERDYHEISYDEEDILGSGHFDILKGGIFPYDDNNHLGNDNRAAYSSDYSYTPKDSKAVDRVFKFRFPYSFPEVLPTEKKSVLASATNAKGALSHLIAVTSDLDTAD